MKNIIEGVLLGATFIALPPLTASGPKLEQPAEQILRIHLYNFVPNAISSVKSATLQAAGVFKRAAIKTVWEQPPINSPEAKLFDFGIPAGGWSYSGEQPYLIVRIVEDLPSSAYPGALGFALPYAQSGVNVEIIYSRLERYASLAGIETDVLLAYSLAHEIGHVLLRSSTHVIAGIMQSHCDAKSRKFFSDGRTAFLPEQLLQMRKELRRLNMPEKKNLRQDLCLGN